MKNLSTTDLSLFERVISIVLALGGLLTAVLYLFNIGVGLWGPYLYGWGYLYLILAFFIPQVFIYYPTAPKGILRKLDYIAIFLFLYSSIYFVVNGENIQNYAWELSPPIFAVLLGMICSALTIEACRRSVNNIFFVLVLFFFVYPVFASNMPGLLSSRDFSLVRVIGFHVMGPDSMVGVPTKVLGNLFVGFMFFGVLLTVSGASKIFLNLSLALLGSVRGGTAKVSIFSSALTGSISGSVVTNVVTTGSFTIPAMQKAGYPGHYAAAIESCASSGGVLMPPIMGAAAFIMASILDVPYATVVYAALFPSILFYFALFIQVDGYAAKKRLKGLPKGELPSLVNTLKEGWYYIFSFIILIYILFVLRQEAQAPFVASLFVLIVYFISDKIYKNPGKLSYLILDFGKLIGPIASILCGVGFLIGSLLLTGVAQTLSSELISLAKGNALLLVLMGFLASFILGMGLSTTACYLLLAILLAPALIEAGFEPMAVHIFIIYCGTLSFITPPVAIAAFAAAAIAKAPPFKTALQAVVLGLVLFCVPFFIIYDPGFILSGSLPHVIYTILVGIYGVFLLASGIEGYLIYAGQLKLIGRVLIIGFSIVILLPSLGLVSSSLALMASLLFFVFSRIRNVKYLLVKLSPKELVDMG